MVSMTRRMMRSQLLLLKRRSVLLWRTRMLLKRMQQLTTTLKLRMRKKKPAATAEEEVSSPMEDKNALEEDATVDNNTEVKDEKEEAVSAPVTPCDTKEAPLTNGGNHDGTNGDTKSET